MSKSTRRNDVIEHEQIMQAALARNVRRTTELNRAHIELTAEKVAKSLGEIDRRKPVGLTT
jgi:DNA-binding GntR family transcriptional regulator